MNARHSASGTHRWKFFRTGGFDQVAIETADDLRHLGGLDPKLWTALACPTSGLEFDAQTLALLDSNGDGHIGVQELLAAVEWSCRMLADPQVLFDGGELALASIATHHDEGATLRAAATPVLAALGKPDATTLAVADFTDMTRLFHADRLNGDGVVPPELAAAHGLHALVACIVQTQGGAPDRSGVLGATLDSTRAFFEQAAAVTAWRREAQADAGRVLPLGEATSAALAALAAVEAKVDDHYTRCRLAAYDARSAGALNPAPEAYAALAGTTLAADTEALAALPLASVAAGAALPLDAGLNPAWAARIEALRRLAVEPLLGPRDTLSEADWATLRSRLAEYAAWHARQPATAVAEVDAATLEALVADDAQARLEALIAQDSASDASAATLDALRRLVHCQRDLVTLLRNFVTMSDFYGPKRQAIFQTGTLYLDQRSCDLVLRVADMDAHARMAPFSHCYLVYCRCTRPGEAPQTVAAALTAGAVDELMVEGRHGVFVDRGGNEWNATVVKVVEQPVSLRQAYFAPYRRVAAFVENQVRNFAASKDAQADASLQGAAAAPTAPPPATAFDIARFAGIFAAIGLAIGAIGTALSAALVGLFQLVWWQWPLVVAGVLLVISGPSMLLAGLKLRRRSLGPLLDANGWAVNARARINIPFGTSLTQVATLPANAERSLSDPYADKRSPWPALLLLATVAAALAWAWWQGWFGGV